MRILLVRAGALGDVLLLRWAIGALRRSGHRVTLLAPRASSRVLLGPGGAEAHALLDWEDARLARLLAAPLGGPAERDGLASAIADHDAAILLSRNEALAAVLAASIPKVVVRDPEPAPGWHAAHWYADAGTALGCALGDAPPVLTGTDGEREAAAPWLERLPRSFVALHPGSGSSRKNWPLERFLAVARELTTGQPFLVSVGPAELTAIPQLTADPQVILAQELHPRLLGVVLAHASLFVGNDSGVSHLAAAFGAPTLALFGPTDPAVWAPIGPRVAVLRAPRADLETLATAEVLGAARRAQHPL